MSCETTIQVADVGKSFEIYQRPEDRIKQFIFPHKQYYQPFWALQHVSFEVQRGQSVGIIGQNGSGKSTLLQLITGILTPTYGSIEVIGRVGALIELGSGFNLEFTGRENVYLNGSLLGLSQDEIERKFDQIAAFADIGEHLNRPVKTYSSGMMLRLAFAVQMAVEPDILIIDEALAVGDARFQLKCFRRLEELKSQGTTILFVSHSIETVRSFCDRGLLLNQGRLVYDGDAKKATTKYLSILFPEQKNTSQQSEGIQQLDTVVIQKNNNSNTEYVLRIEPDKVECHTFGVGGAQLHYFEMHGLSAANMIESGQCLKIICQFSWDIAAVMQQLIAGLQKNITLGVALADVKGNYIFGCNGFDSGLSIDCFSQNNRVVEFTLAMPPLLQGDYFMSVAIALGNLENHVQLKWYDCLVPLKIVKGKRNVFGLVAIDYQMKTHSEDGSLNEQVTAINL